MPVMDAGQAGGVVLAAVAGGGAVLGALRLALRGSFVSLRAHAALEDRVDVVEARLAQTPTHQDLTSIGSRLSGVETTLAGVGEKVTGVGDGVRRVERMTDMLLKSMLEKERDA